MYQEFKLSVFDASIMGYHWKLENPNHVVVLIHGIGEHAGRFNRVAQIFNEHNIGVVAMDLRGHGCSSGKRGHTAPRTSVLSDVDELIKFAKTQYEGKPLFLYGHSMGGNIVLDYRHKGKYSHEMEGYIVTSPWIVLKRKIPKTLVGPVTLIGKLNPEMQLSAGIKPKMLGNREVISQHLHPELMHNKITLLTGIENYKIGLQLMEGTCQREDVNGCDKPLLLMHGSDDKICSVEGSRRIAEFEGEKCHYIEWHGYFHELHNGTKDYDGSEPTLKIAQWIEEF